MPWEKYSDVFWNVVRQCCAICRILPGSHDEIVDRLSRLSCVKAYAKEGFAVVEFHSFVVVGFREEKAAPDEDFAPFREEAAVDYRFDAKRIVDKLDMETPKPVFFTGHGSAGFTALFAASPQFVSGVVTFGLPEKQYEDASVEPGFSLGFLYNFQLENDKLVESWLSNSLLKQRIEIPSDLITEEERESSGIERIRKPVNRAAIKYWKPEERFDLDELLGELVGEDKAAKQVTHFCSPGEKLKGPLKSPLKIVVYHHDGDARVAEPYVDSLRLLFDGLANEHEGYLAGASGLPGVLRVITQPPCEKEDIERYFNDTLHTVFIVLVDDSLAGCESMKWVEAASEFSNSAREHIVFPIGMYDRAFSEVDIFKNFSSIQRTNSTSLGEEAVRSSYSALLVVHEVYKLLAEFLPGENRLTIFLSHTKKDGLPLAGAVWSQIANLPGNIDHHGFYDAKSLETGKPWSEQLRAVAGNCVMVVLRTRLYETRPWCREEFITAVENDVPIIVVDARNGSSVPGDPGNKCAARESVLPYHRYPVTHVQDGNLIRVLGLTLTEGLRQLIFARDVQQVGDIHLSSEERTQKFRLNSGVEGLMELCGELSGQRTDFHFLYQGAEISEIQQEAYDRVIQKDFPEGKLRTCTRLYDEYTQRGRGIRKSLVDECIGISITEFDGYLNTIGVNKLTLHAVERIFSHGGTVAFGHDWRKGGVMEAVYDSMRRSQSVVSKDPKRIRIYNKVPRLGHAKEPEGGSLQKALRSLEVEYAELPELTERDESEKAPEPEDLIREFTKISAEYPDFRKGWNALVLSEMRIQLVELCTARICIGGKIEKATGAMSGIFEEAVLTIVAGQPLYLCGHWKGATGAICEILSGKKEHSAADFYPIPEVTGQLTEIRELASEKGWKIPGLTPEDAFEIISNTSLELLAERNGLSVDENLELFELSDIRQIMSLVLKGLSVVKNSGST
ncbi:MAG: hypothetical protein P1V20_05140 [Verrucomicrobiales bacterium]|nr:hypothetical protein [Verrucomicrobiales bacterium]